MPQSTESSLEKISKGAVMAELERMFQEAEKSPSAFVNNFCYTFNPRIEPYHFPFHLWDYQKDLIETIAWHIENGEDLFIEKCRDMGVTYCLIDTFLWFWRYIPGSNFLLGSRKQDFVDNRNAQSTGNKEESLFGKLDYTMHRLPPRLLPAGFEFNKHLTYMSLMNPENGNVIGGESSNQNFSRGGRYKAVGLDEFAFWDNDTEAWGSTADTTSCRVVLTTPGMRPNTKAMRLRFGKDGEKIKIVSLTYNLDPRKTPEWLDAERRRRSAEDFAREIMINWESSQAGRVYPEIENAKLGKFPYMPGFPLYNSWDFGLDGVAIGWWQRNQQSGKPRLVDAFFRTDKPIQWFFPLFGKPIDSKFTYNQDDLDAINAVKMMTGAIHFGDPDVAKRSLLTGTTTRQELQEAGIYVQTRPETNDFGSRRERTKVLLQGGIEVNDTPRTRFFIDAIKESVYPERQDTSQTTTPIIKPVHNWASHHRTQLEYFAVNVTFEPKVGAEAAEAPEWFGEIKNNWQRPS